MSGQRAQLSTRCTRRRWPWLLQDTVVHQERWLFPLRDIRRTVSKGNWHGSLRPWWFPLRFFYGPSIDMGVVSRHSIYTLGKVSPSAEMSEGRRLAPEYNSSRVYTGVSSFINNHLGGSAAPVAGTLTFAVMRGRGRWPSVTAAHTRPPPPVISPEGDAPRPPPAPPPFTVQTGIVQQVHSVISPVKPFRNEWLSHVGHEGGRKRFFLFK